MHNINEPFFTLFVFLCWIFETYFFERYQTIRLYIYYIKHVPYFTTYVILFSYFFLETKYFIHIKKSTKSKITKIFIMFLTGIKIPIMSKLFNMQLPNGRSSLTKIGTQLIVRKLKKQKQKKKQKKTKSIPAHMRSLPRIPLPRTGMKVKPRKFWERMRVWTLENQRSPTSRIMSAIWPTDWSA